MMKIDLSTEQTEQLDISRIRQMSESQISCLLTSGDIIAYAGKADQRQLFRINRIPTNYQDENRRYACVNLAFEGDDAESVNQIAAFALAEYPRFAIMVNQMIVYGETEAQIKIGVLKSWINDAKQANLSFPPEKTIVVSGEGGEQAAQKLLNWVAGIVFNDNSHALILTFRAYLLCNKVHSAFPAEKSRNHAAVRDHFVQNWV